MAFVQAYKRTKTYTHTFAGSAPLVFEPNEVGDVVCDVQDSSAVDRLLQTPTGFRLYGVQAEAEPLSDVLLSIIKTPVIEPVAAPEGVNVYTPPADGASEAAPQTSDEPEPEPEPEPESPYILRNGADVLDLRTLDDDALRTFADANKIKVHHACKGDTIRDKIVKALTE